MARFAMKCYGLPVDAGLITACWRQRSMRASSATACGTRSSGQPRPWLHHDSPAVLALSHQGASLNLRRLSALCGASHVQQRFPRTQKHAKPQGSRSAHPYGRLSHDGRPLAKEHTHGTAYRGFLHIPPSCGARHEGGHAESRIMPCNTWQAPFASAFSGISW
jgi:hypothetical protein